MSNKLPKVPVTILSTEELEIKAIVTRAQKYQATQQYKLAIQTYTNILDRVQGSDEKRDIYLARSLCYVAAGLPEQAVEDADTAISLDQNFCNSYYQKAEAYFSNGQFEQALINYYKAYQQRPDIDKFRLGVQKAESAVLKAVQICIAVPSSETGFGKARPTERELREALLTQQATSKSRCLCGCQGCDSRCCCDFQDSKEFCICTCTSCARHNLYTHNLIYEPSLQLYIRVSDLFKTDQGNSTAHTPNQNAGSVKPYQQQQQKHAHHHKTGLEQDRDFIEELLGEQHVMKNKQVAALSTTSRSFIQTKNNFWSQQGDVHQNQSKKFIAQKIKQPPAQLQALGQSQDLSSSQVLLMNNNELLQRIVQKIQQAQDLLNAEDYGQALLIMQTVEKQAQQIEIIPEQDQHYVCYDEKNKLLSDSFTLIGCVYYRLGQHELAIQNFAIALDYALNYVVIPNPNQSPTKLVQQIYERQVIHSKALEIRCLRVLYQTFIELKQYDRAIECLEQLQQYDYLPYFKAIDLQQQSYCYYQLSDTNRSILEASSKTAISSVETAVGEPVDFKIRKKYQIKVLPNGIKQFQEVAPSWLGVKHKQIKDVVFQAFWLIYQSNHSLSTKEMDEYHKNSIAALKDGLLFADRAGEKTVVAKFLEELKKYEDVE